MEPVSRGTPKFAVRPGLDIGRRRRLVRNHDAVGPDELPVQRGHQFKSGFEQPFAERFTLGPLDTIEVLAEVLKILAIVEQVEAVLVLPRPKQVRTQPRPSAHHLPELGLRPDQLEEHQVDHFRDVDPGVEHVHREREVRRFLLDGKIVDQALDILGRKGDDPGELALEVGIVDVKPLRNKVGMGLVLGKEDRLPQPITASHHEPVCHQVRQNLVDGVRVEQPPIHSLRLDPDRHRAIIIPIGSIPLILLRFRKVGVCDAIALKLEGHRDRLGRHQKPVRHRLFQRVGVGWYTVLKVEEAIGVPIDLILRGRREDNEHGIEVVEDGSILLEHRSVGLVDDHQVEMPHAEPPLAIPGLVDQPHDRGIGADEHSAIGIPVRHQIDGRRIRQMPLEGVDGLIDQGHPVGQEQDPLGPVAAHQ